jgi:hypothetical protein
VPEAEVATGKLKRYKSPGVDLIPAEIIQKQGKHYIQRFITILS